MTPLAQTNDAAVYHATWAELLKEVPSCDAVIVDAPYSSRTHKGAEVTAFSGHKPPPYASWGSDDVRAFVRAWAPVCRGWFVSITDHVLVPDWEGAFKDAGLYAFAPLPFVELGKQPRVAGDGPATWTCQVVVARPKNLKYSRWGSLPGAYVLSGGLGHQRDRLVIGGKPVWLMEHLVRDYTRAGDLVVDPCAGAGSTLVACQRLGRRSIGGDAKLEHAQIAAERIGRAVQTSMFEEAAQQTSMEEEETP